MNFNEEDVRKTYKLLSHNPQTEIRLIDPHKVMVPQSFFVGSEQEFVDVCKKHNGKYNIYAGINERRDKGTNRLDVISVKTIVIDIDAIHPKDEAATDEELRKAANSAEDVFRYLLEKGIEKRSLMMSGNGYQIWLSIPEIKITNDNRNLIESKIKKFHKELQAKFSDDQNCSIDNIGDLPRIIKIAGTLSIKGKNTDERPYRVAKWESFEGRNELQKLRDYILMLEKKDDEVVVNEPKIEGCVNKEFLDIFLLTDKYIKNLVSKDYKLKKGDREFKSRSEREMSACVRLFNRGFDRNQTNYIMSKLSKIGWLKKPDAYKKITLDKAKKYIEKIAAIKQVKKEDKKPTTSSWSMAMNKFIDYIGMAEEFLKIQPIYYDRNRIWWIWNYDNNCWEITDEIDIMNKIDDSIRIGHSTQSNIKNEILEALKRKARLNKPEDIKETWVQFKNVIIDFETNIEIKTSSNYFAVNPIPWKIGKSDETLIMDKIFEQWVGKEYVSRLYEILAFCISNTYFIHRLFCFVGSGSNGKSKFFGLIRKFVGETNYCSADLDNLIINHFQSAKLFKRLVCLMGETNFNTMSKTSLLKNLTGQDPISFEFKRKDPFDGLNYAKILISTNALPVTEDKTIGFYRRWSIISFPNQFSEEIDILKCIPDYEYENLANKCINILKNLWKVRTFTNEETIAQRREKYEEQSNPLGIFIKESCVIDVNTEVANFEFYDMFNAFLKDRGYRIMSKIEVGRVLKGEGYDIKNKNVFKEDGTRTTHKYIYGLRLKTKNDYKMDAEREQKTLVEINE